MRAVALRDAVGGRNGNRDRTTHPCSAGVNAGAQGHERYSLERAGLRHTRCRGSHWQRSARGVGGCGSGRARRSCGRTVRAGRPRNIRRGHCKRGGSGRGRAREEGSRTQDGAGAGDGGAVARGWLHHGTWWKRRRQRRERRRGPGRQRDQRCCCGDVASSLAHWRRECDKGARTPRQALTQQPGAAQERTPEEVGRASCNGR
mmetsp:Transcript_32191/g.80158  ORF Transcript_32191/g.80158 Transcript_32191/m.80158 type:complete len:203 (-) Transcript_32191:2051-2659(-)